MSEAFNIVGAAWGHLSKNWLNTLKVFLIPYLLAMIFIIFVVISVAGIYNSSRLFILSAILWAVMASLAFFWGAVRFHRYILLDEEPQWIGHFMLALSAKYTLSVILISIVMGLVVALPIGALVSLVGLNLITLFLSLPIILFALYLGVRLSPILVERALGRERSLRDIWMLSKPHNMVFWGLAVIAFGFRFLSELLGRLEGHGLISILGSLLDILLAVIAIAILTETYHRFFKE